MESKKSVDIPVVVESLQSNLGNTSNDLYSLGGANGELHFSVDWDNITEFTDSLGHTSYTFIVRDFDDDPYTFRNIIVRRYGENSFSQPYLYTYTMSDEFKAQYLLTGSVHGFQGTILKQQISGTYTQGLFSANIEGPKAVVNNTDCPNSTSQVGGNSGGGSGPPIDNNPNNNPDYDNTIYNEVCYDEWIDFDDSTSCGNNCVTASRSILVTVCYTTAMSSSDDTGCADGEVAVVDDYLDYQTFGKLCSTIQFKHTANSFKAEIEGLGGTWVDHYQRIGVNVEYGVNCVDIPQYNVATANDAAESFTKIFNEVRTQIERDLEFGFISPTSLEVKGRLTSLINYRLNLKYPGATFGLGECLGDIPMSVADYSCN